MEELEFLLRGNDIVKEITSCSDSYEKEDCREPHYALFLVLGYLDSQDLISIEMVCKSLNYAVKTDPSLWNNIVIEHPLDKKLTDDALLNITSRACGYLKSLTLVWCYCITNSAIRTILGANPFLTKLSVAGCFGLRIKGLLATFKLMGSTLSVKQLRVAGVCFDAGITSLEHEKLKVLLDNGERSHENKPPLYIQRMRSCILVDDDRALDVDMCPVCDRVTLVFDCPLESCQKSKECRGCFLCVPRCIFCGCCFVNGGYYVTIGKEVICFDCWDRVYRCQLPTRYEIF